MFRFPRAGSIRREAEELQPLLEKKGAVRRAGAMRAVRPLGLRVPLRLLPHPRQAALLRVGAPESALKVGGGGGGGGR